MKRILYSLLTFFVAGTTLTASNFTPAAFSISADGKTIVFSQGNLQYTQSTKTWAFATNQYDALNAANISNNQLADKIDLFGWSGSMGTAKWGISTSTDNANYAGDFADWGKNISDGITYRTLTKAEWFYLFYTRPDADEKQGIARIQLSDTEYANGLILLPDSWTCPTDVPFKSGYADANEEQQYADYQTFTLTQWQALESAGAVFLPATGYRSPVDMFSIRKNGAYWSATASSSSSAYYIYFGAKTAFPDHYEQYCYGHAVRLVQDCYAIKISSSEHGRVSVDKTKSIKGNQITLTIAPETYYILKTISVLQGNDTIQLTAVEGTNYQYSFTMPAGDVQITAEFEKAPHAFTPAAFSISADGKQVAFSQGNLLCTGVTTGNYTWSFTQYQTEILGTANVRNGQLADTIDLFGWSGSTGTAKWGISTSETITDYAGDFVDWGKNVGDSTSYRTLTYDEWDYLLNTRANADERIGVARIELNNTEYVNGLILLPDEWACPTSVTFKSGNAESYATCQRFTLAQWVQLEAAGAVFLPASGARYGTRVNPSEVQSIGCYWSATPNDNDKAGYSYFAATGTGSNHFNRYAGISVRLVQYLYAITLTTPEHGVVTADQTNAAAGKKVTLTITPDAYYKVKTISVLQGTTNIPTTAVKGASDQYTFTMPNGNVSVSVELESLPTAFTPTAFSISDSTQIYFSQGNLRCMGVKSGNYAWAFSDYQTDMLGFANITGNSSDLYIYGVLADTIDLFGWSSTGTAKWGVSISYDNKDYTGDFVDWGKNIGDGTTYRTLAVKEWEYLINGRTDAAEKYGIARIQLSSTTYANGIVLLPDNWTCPDGITFKSGLASGDVATIQAYADHQTFTPDQWEQLEASGAVFLPASGSRNGPIMFISDKPQHSGYYWSSDTIFVNENQTGDIFFQSNMMQTSRYERYTGMAVRLVQNIYAITINTSEHGAISADKTKGAAGEIVTLTITPDEGYELATLSVKDTAGQAVTVGEDHTFSMPACAVTISATFKVKTVTITATAENGTVTGDGTFNYGTEVTLTATPAENYRFEHWSDGTTANPYLFTATEDLTIEAIFVSIPTAIDQAESTNDEIRKELRNGQVYILRNGHTYTPLGTKVE